MTEHTHSYTNFQMFVLVHNRFMVIIWLNCYHEQNILLETHGSTPEIPDGDLVYDI